MKKLTLYFVLLFNVLIVNATNYVFLHGSGDGAGYSEITSCKLNDDTGLYYDCQNVTTDKIPLPYGNEAIPFYSFNNRLYYFTGDTDGEPYYDAIPPYILESCSITNDGQIKECVEQEFDYSLYNIAFITAS